LGNFVIGSAESMTLKVTLTNTGDPSFNTKLVITLPNLPVTMPPRCQDMENGTETVHHLECDAGNPLKANTRRDCVFLINIGTSNIKDIDVHAALTSATPFANPNTASSSISLPLLSQADVTVYGYCLCEMRKVKHWHIKFTKYRMPDQEIYMFNLDGENKEESKVAVSAFYMVWKWFIFAYWYYYSFLFNIGG
jgi:hypothetical protein